MPGAKFKLQQVLCVCVFFQEQIQKQLDHLKELRKSGEEQRSQGDKKTVNSLVRLGVVCGLSLTGFTPVEGSREPRVSRGPSSPVLAHRETELITYLGSPAPGRQGITGVQR